jgi:hypothetical protein
MTLIVGAKSTKPGSKSTSKRTVGQTAKPARVPVGLLHLINASSQSNNASFNAVCGEDRLVAVDCDWADDFANDRCEICSEQHWIESFNQMQSSLL